MSDVGNANWLWWIMLITGVAGGVVGIASSVVDRRRADWPNARQRLVLYISSYALMTLSILAFVLRGLIAPA